MVVGVGRIIINKYYYLFLHLVYINILLYTSKTGVMFSFMLICFHSCRNWNSTYLWRDLFSWSDRVNINWHSSLVTKLSVVSFQWLCSHSVFLEGMVLQIFVHLCISLFTWNGSLFLSLTVDLLVFFGNITDILSCFKHLMI